MPLRRSDGMAERAKLPPPSAPPPSRLPALHAAMLAALLGGRDLERVAALAADAVGGSVAIMVPAAGVAVAWPPRPEPALDVLGRYVTHRLALEPAQVPDGLALELPVGADGDALGTVLLLDAPDGGLGDAGDVLHLVATTAQIGMALNGTAGGEKVAENLLLDLLEHPGELAAPEILSRAWRAGTDLASGAVAAFAEDNDGTGPYWIEAALGEEFPTALVLRRGDRLHALLPARRRDREGEETMRAALRLAARLEPEAPLALSPFEPAPERLSRALREAQLAAAVVQRASATSLDASSGVYRLLLRLASEHPDELRRFYAATVRPVAEYDTQHQTQLLETLRAYLANDCNMNATAAAIFAHRHTVAYRLERVRELTALDAFRHEDRERIGLGLKAWALLSPEA